jgi:hypothetical protein
VEEAEVAFLWDDDDAAADAANADADADVISGRRISSGEEPKL